MKRVVRILLMQVMMATSIFATAQNKIDDERMKRDIEVAENVLVTLIRQKFEKKGYLGFDVEGRYMPGYGVTFRVPGDNYTSLVMSIARVAASTPGAVVVGGGTPDAPGSSYTYTYQTDDGVATTSREKIRTKVNRDSAVKVYNQRLVEVAKDFLADYADLIGQLSPAERVVVTNRGGESSGWYNYMKSQRGSMLTVEATKADIAQYRQGKVSRDAFMGKVKVVNTETVEELAPDLELFSSILNRLYRPDLSSTYFTQENIYYERLKDFGAIYYMNVYSSQPDDFKRHAMPTLKLDDVDQATRDKKVKELYPAFEKDIKENFVEYGRTLKSLKDNESLVLNVRLTKCEGCGIPSTLELSLPATSLKDYNSGKLTKEAVLGAVNMKKGANQ